jgi:glycosyltransferase involved in cell wall biosynthesis
VPEVVIEGTTGLLVPARDSRALALAIKHLLREPGERLRMGANATEFVRRNFSREVMAKGMEHLYQRLLEA